MAALIVGLSWWQVDAFLHPRRQPALEMPATWGLDYQNVVFAAADGIVLHGWYLPSQNGAAIIVGHGFRAPLASESVRLLATHGYGVLVFDWRAHGQSEGDVCTFGYHEVRDVAGALDWLQGQLDVDPGRIGMLGESMGAVTAIRAAAQLPDIRAVVAESPYASLEEAMRNIWRGTGLPEFPFVPLQIALGQWRVGLDLADMQPLRDVAAISPRPILILTGGRDPVTGSDAGQRYYAAAGEPKELWYEPDIGHLAHRWVFPVEYEQRILEFFDATLVTR
jgi:pimeloyl-ACP methyl ester carboxylesterase